MKKILFILLLGLTNLLTGCAGALLGDNNGNANASGSRDQRSIEQVTADGQITSHIRARYSNDVVLRQLNVSTYRGVVTLYGSVPTRNVMERAVDLARSVRGVKKVESRLQVR